MYKSGNRRIVESGTYLRFVAEKTGNEFNLCLEAFCEGVRKGVRVSGKMPEGTKLFDGFGNELSLDGTGVVPKGGNSCMVVDTDENSYDLFSVELVDHGKDNSRFDARAGMVLYFHSDAAAPDWRNEGKLVDDPSRFLE